MNTNHRSKRLLPLVALVLAIAAWLPTSRAAGVDTGKLKFTVNPTGGGFIDEIEFAGRRIATFQAPGTASNPGFESPAGAIGLAELNRTFHPDRAAAIPCKLTRPKTRHGMDKVMLENGFVRVSIVPRLGRRIAEMSDLLNGQNHFAFRYENGELPDLSKQRVFLGGFEDAIDRSDDAWRTAYQLAVVAETAKKVSVVVTANVDNPGEGGKELRLARTMTLQIGSPVLSMRIEYTVLGGKQNVKMMPHPEPFAGSQPDPNDHFYASSKGQVRHASFQDNGEGDVYLPLDEADHWAAICDLRQRHTLINTFTGPMDLLDIYLTKTSYTLEPYTRQVEGLEEGRSLTMDLAYWSCYNLDAVHYADNEIAGEMLLQKDVLGRDEALKAKIAMVSATAPGKVDLLPRMLKTTVGNDHLLPDVWRLDNSGEYYWDWLLSDKMRWPKWRVGGLLVDSRWHYRIWKSNRADTSATTTYEGTRSPGWLDVSDGNDWGVTAVFPDNAMSAAPKGITFDAESGVLTVSLQPSQSLPRRVAVGEPPLKAHFRLEFHTTRIPTRYQPELTDAQYRRLLESVKDHWCFYGNSMVYAGLRADLSKDTWIQRLIEADMPPSALLRTYEPFLPAALERLGKDFVPSSNKEDNIRRLLHFYRTGEILPPPSPIVPK